MKKLKEKGLCLPPLSESDLGEFDQYILSIETHLSKSIAESLELLDSFKDNSEVNGRRKRAEAARSLEL